jgi:hypothetical protein
MIEHASQPATPRSVCEKIVEMSHTQKLQENHLWLICHVIFDCVEDEDRQSFTPANIEDVSFLLNTMQKKNQEGKLTGDQIETIDYVLENIWDDNELAEIRTSAFVNCGSDNLAEVFIERIHAMESTLGGE